MSRDFDDLLAEAEQAHFSGWDFSFLQGRLIDTRLSWDYHQIVRSQFATARRMLDLDTGGGERLAAMAPLPRFTVATESFGPNVLIAARRLAPLNAHTVQVDANVQNQYGPSHGHPERCLPFDDDSFDLIACRHGSFSATEIARLLRPGGHFVAQLVGEDNFVGLNEHLHGPRTIWRRADELPPSLEQAGLVVLDRREEKPSARFTDIGAIVYYLKAVPWQIADFSVTAYKDRLVRLHEFILNHGGFEVHAHRQLIVATKPGRPHE